MATKIQALWTQITKTFVLKKSGSFHIDQENLSVLRRQVDSITQEDVALGQSLSERERRLRAGTGERAPVTYIEICSCDSATLEVFILHAGHRMPLHDHPHMIGILKVISGSVRVDSYTVISCESRTPGSVVLLAKKQTDVVSTDDPACVLTPTESNLHAISPINAPAAFVDILSPPYHCEIPGVSPNPCTFYAEAGLVDGSVPGEKLVRLVEVPMPKEYWCDMAPYRGPQIKCEG